MRGLGVLVAVAMLASGACNGGSDAPWTLRPNVTEVLSAPSELIKQTVVTDVDREGDRIVLLRPSIAASSLRIYAYLSISDDLGRTWRHVQVRREVASELGGDTHQIGIHLQDGKVYLMLSRDIGSSYPAFAVWEVDTATGDTTEVPIGAVRTGWFAAKRPDGHLRYALIDGSFGESPRTLFELDPATGESTYDTFPCSGMACTTPYFQSSDGGETFDGYTLVEGTLPVCVSHWDVARRTSTQACVNRPVWPGRDYSSYLGMMMRGATPYLLWSVQNQTYATAILPGPPPTLSETLQLGPGTVSSKYRLGTFFRRRFAQFELVENPDPTNLVGVGRLTRLVEGAPPEQVDFPVTPCVNDVGCGHDDPPPPSFGYGQVQWILPLENGEYLVVYTTVVDQTGTQTIYLARERPRFGPIVGGVAPPAPTVELPAGAQPMNPLEQACALYANCQASDPTVIYDLCLARWSTDSANRPGTAAARARFIAAATSCASLRAVAESGCPLECTESGGTCGASGTGPCTTEVTYVPGDCTSCDGSGNYHLCTGSRMFTVACTGGTSCTPGGVGCALPASSCGAFPTSCVGGAVQACDAFQRVTLERCELKGAMCGTNPMGATTCVPTSSDGACDPRTYSTRCASGTHLLHCNYGQIRYVACRDLGYSQCSEVAGGAVCR